MNCKRENGFEKCLKFSEHCEIPYHRKHREGDFTVFGWYLEVGQDIFKFIHIDFTITCKLNQSSAASSIHISTLPLHLNNMVAGNCT